MSRRRLFQLGWVIVAAIALLFLPMLVGELSVHLAVEILVYALFAVSFNLLAGYGGMMPFGHAALFAVGAYATALICNNLPGVPLLLALVIAALLSVAAAAIVGFFCIRLKGAYFALLSFAFQMFFFAVASKWRDVTNGPDGMGVARPDLYLPGLGTLSLVSITHFYYFTLVLVATGVLACYLFLKTPLGNTLICTREQDVRASFLGYNVFLARLVVFCASGLLAGGAGGLFVLFQKYVNTGVVDMNMSMTVLLMTVIGGGGHFLGPVLGAAFYVVFQNWISSLTDHWWILLGVVFVVVVLYVEGGLISIVTSDRVRRWMGVGTGKAK
jgi:branched-chain amino acid transport system permease protein